MSIIGIVPMVSVLIFASWGTIIKVPESMTSWDEGKGTITFLTAWTLGILSLIPAKWVLWDLIIWPILTGERYNISVWAGISVVSFYLIVICMGGFLFYDGHKDIRTYTGKWNPDWREMLVFFGKLSLMCIGAIIALLNLLILGHIVQIGLVTIALHAQ